MNGKMFVTTVIWVDRGDDTFNVGFGFGLVRHVVIALHAESISVVDRKKISVRNTTWNIVRSEGCRSGEKRNY